MATIKQQQLQPQQQQQLGHVDIRTPRSEGGRTASPPPDKLQPLQARLLEPELMHKVPCGDGSRSTVTKAMVTAFASNDRVRKAAVAFLDRYAGGKAFPRLNKDRANLIFDTALKL